MSKESSSINQMSVDKNSQDSKSIIQISADDDGNTFLHFDINKETAKALIDAGANINARNKKNRTPLYMACQYGNFDLVKFLIENGADKESACYLTTKTIKKYLFEVGCPVPRRVIMDYGTKEQQNNYKYTFEDAIDDIGNSKRYTEHGGDINKQDEYGLTLLHHAVRQGILEMVKYLVEKGADQKIKDVNGRVPARFSTCNHAIYDILKEHINEPDNYNNTILHESYDNIERARHLINLGARWDIKNNNGETAYDRYRNKEIFKTREERLKELVGDDIKWAIASLLE